MKNGLLSLVVVALLAGSVRADVIFGTSNPASSPLQMNAGSTSGPMFANITSDNPPNDVMSSWQFDLAIVPDSSATGILTFNDPATGAPANPTNYIFGGNGLGIVDTNSGSTLSANDFYNPNVGPGVPVPGSSGANLLKMDFLASSGASGTFDIYALQGAASTSWTDSSFNTLFFSNVPDGSGRDLVGVVDVTPSQTAAPLPSTFAMAGLGLAALAAYGFTGWMRRGALVSIES